LGAILSTRTKSKQNKARWEREDITARHKELAKQEALVQELDNKIGELFEKVKQLEVASFERAATVEKDATTVSLRKSDVSKWEIEMLAREKKYFKDIQAVKGHIKSFEDDCRRKEEEATQRLWEKEELLSQELKKKEEELAL
jgi:D-lyxose ketol-isomerase